MAERDCYPSAKRSKSNYKLCGHCNKELSAKIYKEHIRLYYDAANKLWVQDEFDGDNLSSSEFSSLDKFDVAVDYDTKNAESIGHNNRDHDSDNSDCNWEELLGLPNERGTTVEGIFNNYPNLISLNTCV